MFTTDAFANPQTRKVDARDGINAVRGRDAGDDRSTRSNTRARAVVPRIQRIRLIVDIGGDRVNSLVFRKGRRGRFVHAASVNNNQHCDTITHSARSRKQRFAAGGSSSSSPVAVSAIVRFTPRARTQNSDCYCRY